jgi:branched-chain amino acid transport system ATP-binding protein
VSTEGASAAGTSEIPTAALELVDVVGAYGRTIVLRDVSVTVPAGSVVALLGPNGAGKSTLLKIAAGMLRPRAGTVRVAGKDLTSAPAHRVSAEGLCLVPEGRAVYGSLTVRENLDLFATAKRSAEAVATAVELFPPLGRRIGNRAGTLSGGEQQMLALARAFVTDPRVVLVDELSMGLAPIVVGQLFDSLRTLADRGTALLVVEQYVQDALDLADTAYVMANGRITVAAPVSELDRDAIVRGYLQHQP